MQAMESSLEKDGAQRSTNWGFLLFGLWYVNFGIAAFFAEMNAPFFRVPISIWDGQHRAFLAFGGVYTLHIAVWTLQLSRMPKQQTRRFAASLGIMLTTALPAFVAYLQSRWAVFTTVGLSAFVIDFFFGIYFLNSWRRLRNS